MDPRQSLTDALLAAHHSPSQATAAVSPPDDYATAMRVQAEVTRGLGASLAGWKVGFAPDGTAVAGPIHANVLRASPARFALREGGCIIEIELAFRLARDLPAQPYTRDEILAAVDEALIGIELVAGRLGEPPAVPYLAFLADNIGNAGYVTGSLTRAFRGLDLKALPLRFTLDGALVEEKRGGHPQGDPVEPLRAYASKPIDALGGLRKGQVITTGSLSKPLRLERGATLEAALEGVGSVTLELTR